MRSEKVTIVLEMLESLSKDPGSILFSYGWIKSLLPGQDPLINQIPWLNFKSIRWLKSHLKHRDIVFEYGSGASTIFISRRVRKLTSIEHDKSWYIRVSDALAAEGISNCELILREPERSTWERMRSYGPTSYTASTDRWTGMSFERYVKSIEEFEDGSIDLVIVDGKARASCMYHAVPKVSAGGHLLLDDSDVQAYREAMDLLSRYEKIDLYSTCPYQTRLKRSTIWHL